jgi:hypothetical protein
MGMISSRSKSSFQCIIITSFLLKKFVGLSFFLHSCFRVELLLFRHMFNGDVARLYLYYIETLLLRSWSHELSSGKCFCSVMSITTNNEILAF